MSIERSELTVRIGVVTFPGSLDDRVAARAISRAEAEPVALWHGDEDLRDVDAVVPAVITGEKRAIAPHLK